MNNDSGQRRVRPLNDYVFVSKDPGPEKIGRIIVPVSYRDKQRDTYHRGVVKAVGLGRLVTCPLCVLGYKIETGSELEDNDGETFWWACTDLLQVTVVEAKSREKAVAALREAVEKELRSLREVQKITPEPPDCEACGGTGLSRLRKNAVEPGDVVWLSEYVSGKAKIMDPVALGLEEQLGARPLIVVTSDACALFEDP